MTAEFDLGDNYSIDENADGDLVIRDGNGNTVLKHNNGTGKLTAPSQTVNSASDVAVKDYVDSVAQGLDWQDSVIDEQNDPPSSPNTGDRYLIDDNPTGDWSGEPNEIAEWDGSKWVFFDPNDGWAVFLEDVDLLKVYDSGQADWIAFGSAIDHGALAGLGDDDHTQYLLVDGSRNMSGSLDMGSNAITNASSVNTGSATINNSITYPDGTTTSDSPTNVEWVNAGLPSQQSFDGSAKDEWALPFEATRDDMGTYDNTNHEWFAPETGLYMWNAYIDIDNVGSGESIELGQMKASSSEYPVGGSPHLANRSWATSSNRVMAVLSIVDYIEDTSQAYTMRLQYGGSNTLTGYSRGDNAKLEIVKLDSRTSAEI